MFNDFAMGFAIGVCMASFFVLNLLKKKTKNIPVKYKQGMFWKMLDIKKKDIVGGNPITTNEEIQISSYVRTCQKCSYQTKDNRIVSCPKCGGNFR